MILSHRVGYVWYRNFTVWCHYWYTTVVGSLGETVLYFVAFGYGLGHFVRSIEGMPYIEFLAPAVVASSTMHAAAFETTYSSYTRMTVQRTFHSMAATPINLHEIVAGEILWGMTKSLLPGTVIFLATIVLGYSHSPLALGVLPLLLLVGFLFSAIGMLMSSFAKDYDFFTYFFTLFLEPMFLFSGTFFPLTVLPEIVQKLAWALPLTHPVYIFRSFYHGVVPEHLILHILWLLLLSAIIFIWTTRRMVRRLVD